MSLPRLLAVHKHATLIPAFVISHKYLCPLLPLFPRPIQSLPFEVPLECHLLLEVHLDCRTLACTGSSELCS